MKRAYSRKPTDGGGLNPFTDRYSVTVTPEMHTKILQYMQKYDISKCEATRRAYAMLLAVDTAEVGDEAGLMEIVNILINLYVDIKQSPAVEPPAESLGDNEL